LAKQAVQDATGAANPPKLFRLPVGAIGRDPLNPRYHSREQIRAIAKSIEAFGFNAPILVDRHKPSKPKRDLVLPINSDSPAPRPMHAERRAKHLRAIALGRKWLQDLITGKAKDAEAIAAREGRSARSVNMMISLSFVAPDIIEAATAGRLPRGIGVTRLVDLPLSWAEQKMALGLPAKF
jgi:site-specific DNA recombinase